MCAGRSLRARRGAGLDTVGVFVAGLDLGGRPERGDRRRRDLQAVAVGGAVVADVGDDGEAELPGALHIRVAGAQLHQRVGLAARQRQPRLTGGGAHLLGHVVQHLLDQDPVQVREPPTSGAHPDLGLAPGPDLAGLHPPPRILSRQRPGAAGQLLQIERRQVLPALRPFRIALRGRQPGERLELLPRQLTRGGRVCQHGCRLQRPRHLDRRPGRARRHRDVRHRLQRLALVEHPCERQLLDLQTALLPAHLVAATPHPGGLVAAEVIDHVPIGRHRRSPPPVQRTGCGHTGEVVRPPYRTHVRLSRCY